MANSIPANEALEALETGNQRFVNDTLENPRTGLDRRGELTEGQAPFAVILSCADSRVIPEVTFDQGLGDLFVVRVAGNVANTSSLASIEYAVAHLGTKLIVVLGHEKCGAIQAALGGDSHGYNLDMLIAHMKPAVTAQNDWAEAVKENARLNAHELRDRSSIIAKSEGLEIRPAYYELETGKVEFL